jgi:hypothetical protein
MKNGGTTMKKETKKAESFLVEFYEAEHTGDLNRYIADLVKSGAKVGASELDDEDETALVKVTVENKAEFIENFSKTESFGFSSLY